MAIDGTERAAHEQPEEDSDALGERRRDDLLSCGTVMAHLWLPEDGDAAWTRQPLGGETALGASAGLLRATAPEGHRWVLLAAPSVRVNGSPVAAGIVALRDRDEICADGRRVFFSTESLAEVVPYPGGERTTFCPRCRLEIAAGTLAVRCPHCGVWHHQSAELPCWTYAERCVQCDQRTALDAGYRWTPEEL